MIRMLPFPMNEAQSKSTTLMSPSMLIITFGSLKSP